MILKVFSNRGDSVVLAIATSQHRPETAMFSPWFTAGEAPPAMQPQDACSPAAAPLHALSSQQTVNLFFPRHVKHLQSCPEARPSLCTQLSSKALFFWAFAAVPADSAGKVTQVTPRSFAHVTRTGQARKHGIFVDRKACLDGLFDINVLSEWCYSVQDWSQGMH